MIDSFTWKCLLYCSFKIINVAFILAGLISTEDLIGVIQTLNENATNEEVKEMMNEVDTNEEGTIDFHDFLNIMSKRVKVSTRNTL